MEQSHVVRLYFLLAPINISSFDKVGPILNDMDIRHLAFFLSYKVRNIWTQIYKLQIFPFLGDEAIFEFDDFGNGRTRTDILKGSNSDVYY